MKELDTLLFCFFVPLTRAASFFEMRFFTRGLGFGLKFSSIALLMKFFQLGFKINLIPNGLILQFFDGNDLLLSSSKLHGLKSTTIVELWFPLMTSNVFVNWVESIDFWSVFQM